MNKNKYGYFAEEERGVGKWIYQGPKYNRQSIKRVKGKNDYEKNDRYYKMYEAAKKKFPQDWS